MNKYLLRYIKDCKSSDKFPCALTVKKRVDKFYDGYHGTSYRIHDPHKEARILIFTSKSYGISDAPDLPVKVIFMDRNDSWDKLSSCPIKLPVPTNEREYEKLLIYTRSIILDKAWSRISNEFMTEKWVTSYD